MKTKRIQIINAKVGMQIARDIYSEKDELIIAKESFLTKRGIEKLKAFGIYCIDIYAHEKDTQLNQPDFVSQTVEDDLNHTRSKITESKEFVEFKKTFDSSISHLKKTFGNIISEQTAINTDTLLNEVDSLLKKGRNTLHVFDMMNCMREYDDVTFAHSISVALLCHIMGEWLHYSEEDIKILTVSGLLHDVGKLMIPTELITKPGKLTSEEYTTVKNHVLYGYNILRKQNIDERIKKSALMHHERCDGTGYPNADTAKTIDKFAKIVAIADVYDAMTADRSYRKGMCPFDVIGVFEEDGLKRYDTLFLLTFMEKTVESYIGTTVQLSNDQIGKIIAIHKNFMSRPLVQCGNDFIDLSKKKDLKIVRIL